MRTTSFQLALVVLVMVGAACTSDTTAAPATTTTPTTITTTTTTTTTTTGSTTTTTEPLAEVDVTTCIDHDGSARCWELLAPAGRDAPAPLVIDLHGWTSSGSGQRAVSGFEALSDAEGFVVAWPDGLGRSWNAGAGCCPPASNVRTDDVDLVRELVATVAADPAVDIDLHRVYVTGLSNGCAMAQRLAADASDLVAAVACMSLYLLDTPDPDFTPVPVMELHGTDDRVVAYADSFLFDGAEANFAAWADLDGCEGQPVESWREGESVALTYTDCDAGSEVALVTVADGGHILYAGRDTAIDTTSLAWEFLSRFRLSDGD